MSIARLMQMARAGADVWTDPDLANASYDSVSFSVATEDGAPFGLTFKPYGSRFYMIGRGTDAVYEYSMSSNWDITTASYVQSFSVSSQDTAPSQVQFKPDGSKMYMIGGNTNTIYEYDLSTGWDISTASLLQSYSVSAQGAQCSSMFFRSDGLKLYTNSNRDDEINEWSLSTAWDVSTISFVQSFSVASQEASIMGLFLAPTGLKLYIVGLGNDTVYQYSLSSAWDISTASYDSVSFTVATQETTPRELFFKPDGSKLYIVGSGSDTIYQYST